MVIRSTHLPIRALCLISIVGAVTDAPTWQQSAHVAKGWMIAEQERVICQVSREELKLFLECRFVVS